jgi:ureidoglycolate hydrolase
MNRRLQCQQLEPLTWEPFGWLPVCDTDPLDGSQTLHFEWQDAHVNVICHRAEEVPHSGDGLLCEMFFRHLTHTQVLHVLNCRAVMAVAPASCTFSSAGDLDAVRAFALRPHDSLVLHRGTWHWGPFPVDADQVDMFNVQGLRYRDDNDCVQLGPLGDTLEVLPPPPVS